MQHNIKINGAPLTATFSIMGIIIPIIVSALLFNVFGNADYQERFVFYTFLFSALITLFLCIKSGGKLSKRDIISGVFVGIPNQLAALCIVKAVGELPAYIVYPCYSASVIFVVNVINFLIFREKLSKKEYIATGIIAFAIILINI